MRISIVWRTTAGLLMLLLLACAACLLASTASQPAIAHARSIGPGVQSNQPYDTSTASPTSTGTPAPGTLFCNPTNIVIPSYGAASPYPSTIDVSGLQGTISRVSVTLNSFHHDFYGDVDILLVGPHGESVLLMSDVGDLCHATMDLTFQDGYPPAPQWTCPTPGSTYSPTNYPPDPDSFPTPAPAPPYGSDLSVFNGTGPNGVWSLYVVDDYPDFSGGITNGWCLTLSTETPAATSTATATAMPTGTPTATQTATMTAATHTFVPSSTSTATGLPTSTSTTVPTPTTCSISFSDVHQTDYFYVPVTYLACRGVVSGYPDGTYRPYSNTSRGQLTKIVVLAEGWPIAVPPGPPTFSDVPRDQPFFDYIETAVSHHVITGYGDGTFRPGNDVTRGQLSKIVVLAQGWDLVCPQVPTFPDVPVGSAFYCYVETAHSQGIVSGYPDATFRPGDSARRGQIAKIVYLAVTSTGAIGKKP